MASETPKQRADKVQKQKRVEQAVNALLDGERVQVVVNALMEQYDIAEKTAYEYTKEATARINQKTSENIETRISKHRNRLERLYAKAVKQNDVRGAKQILKDLADLDGLDAPKRTDITTGGQPMQALVKFIGDDIDDDVDDNEAPTD